MKTSINYRNNIYTTRANGLTQLDYADAYVGTRHITYNRPVIKLLLNNPNESIATYTALAFNKSPEEFFGPNQNRALDCSLQFNSIEFKFSNGKLTQDAIERFATLKKEHSGFDAIKTEFNGRHFITIPSTYVKYFIINIIGFDNKAYNKLSRDVATLQRAEQTGTINKIPTGKDEITLKKKEISKGTKDLITKGYCSIQPGNAIPFSILLNVLNNELQTSNKQYENYINKWVPKSLNSKLTIISNKGEYNPYTEGYLTERQASIFIFDILKGHYNTVNNNEILFEVANKILLKCKIELLASINLELESANKDSNKTDAPIKIKLFKQQKQNIENSFDIIREVKIDTSDYVITNVSQSSQDVESTVGTSNREISFTNNIQGRVNKTNANNTITMGRS
ncbi:MAG: hypothetical protein K0R98_278 [Rickettsiaceae bacterium]|jgi:hypothetical protein|nr:hypothetical protein [Rickettsiaceae bacterium]